MSNQHIHFVTGRLAQHALQSLLPALANSVGFRYTVDVLPITVAALMSPEWIAKHIKVSAEATLVLVPGYCSGDLESVRTATLLPVERGPKDLRQLPTHFSREPVDDDYGAWDIEIIAEINSCPRLSLEEIRQTASELARDGADVIDVGCLPGEPWQGVGEVVRALRDDGYRVSIDSLQAVEIKAAVRAGAELVLSVNSSNREMAVDWGAEVVAIPDTPEDLASLDETVDHLAKNGVRLRIDPILEPIGCGFATSLGRYLEVRRRYPDAQMLMGVGNLTELTDADSAGINLLLLGFCQELEIRSVLTTQVINWAQSSVREIALARRATHQAIRRSVPPKHMEPRLVMLRDAEVVEPTSEELKRLAVEVRDNNYRVFALAGEIHLVGSGLHLQDADPFRVMEQLRVSGPGGTLPKNLDPSHAFYLGYELCKAHTALTLGKTYRQDESLDWGMLTREETRHYLKRRANPFCKASAPDQQGDPA